MAINSILPWIVIAVVALVVLRVVVGIAKTSAKMLLWLVIAAAAALGWMWWQANSQSEARLPTEAIQFVAAAENVVADVPR